MKLERLWRDEYLFWDGLFLSLSLHLLFFYASHLSLHLHPKHTVEIDITNMGHMGAAGHPKPASPPTPPPKPAPKPKEWLKPPPTQKPVPAPAPTQPVPQTPESVPPTPAPAPEEPQEYNIGTGEPRSAQLSRLPQLLNLNDLAAILRRFYPEQARVDQRQATVVIDIHIDTDGHVTSADIVRSAGNDFDAAALKAAKLLRFTPAFVGSHRVAVKMRQAIQFKLES